MNTDKIRNLLIDAEFQEREVSAVIEKYELIRTQYKEGDYRSVRNSVNEFCQKVVFLICVESGDDLNYQLDVPEFVEQCLNDEIVTSEPESIRHQVPQMMDAVYQIEEDRTKSQSVVDSSVTQADANAGISLSSWILLELLRAYVVHDDAENIKEIAGVMTQISEPVTENPLQSLVVSRYEFDRHSVADLLKDYVHIVDESGDVQPLFKTDELPFKKRLTVMLLARLAMYDLGYIDELGAGSAWLTDYFDGINTNDVESLSFVQRRKHGAHLYIPGYFVSEAVEYVANSENPDE